MGKNLQRVQDMLDGNYKNKIQSGYTSDRVERKVGDIWTDTEGIKWEQKKGYKVKISKMAHKGLGEKCIDCEKLCIQKWDSSTQLRFGRCYYCQMNWEVDMKSKRIGVNGNKWQHWVRLQQLLDMDAIEREMENKIDDVSRIRNAEDNPFDMSVANALSNANIDNTIEVNKKLTGG